MWKVRQAAGSLSSSLCKAAGGTVSVESETGSRLIAQFIMQSSRWDSWCGKWDRQQAHCPVHYVHASCGCMWIIMGNAQFVFFSMLHERRIIITSKKLSRVTACIHASEALLYPMHWSVCMCMLFFWTQMQTVIKPCLLPSALLVFSENYKSLMKIVIIINCVCVSVCASGHLWSLITFKERMGGWICMWRFDLIRKFLLLSGLVWFARSCM